MILPCARPWFYSICLIAASILPVPAVTIGTGSLAGDSLFVLDATQSVSVYFLSNGASTRENQLYLQLPHSSPLLINSQTATPGDSASVGTFASGTELRFQNSVTDPLSATGFFNYFTGLPFGNADGNVHVSAEEFAGETLGNGANVPPGVLLKFEESFGGGDLSFDDLAVVVTNVYRVPSLILPGEVDDRTFRFFDEPSGFWFDPPSVEGFEYRMLTPGAHFTEIRFPVGPAFTNLYLSIGGDTFGPFDNGSDSHSFLMPGGVDRFRVIGINPPLNPNSVAFPVGFPTYLAFDVPTASFEMSALLATTVTTPEPATAGILAFGLLALAAAQRSMRGRRR